MGSTIHSNRRNKTKRVCLCWRLIIFTRCIITVNTILQAVLVFITWFICFWYFEMWESKKRFLPDVDFSAWPWTIESFPKFDGPLIFFFVKIVYSYKSSKLQTAKEYKKSKLQNFFSLLLQCVFVLKVYWTQPINDSVSQTIYSWSYSCWLTSLLKKKIFST